MPVRSGRVTIQDMDGESHTVEVTAATLYEAVAQGLAASRRNQGVAGIGCNDVNVSGADVRVEHEVKLGDFTKWLDRAALREVSDRHRIRSILGLSVSGSIGFFFAPNWSLDKTSSAGKKSILNSSAGDADVSREGGFHPHSARCGGPDGITRGSQSGRGTRPRRGSILQWHRTLVKKSRRESRS